jgi:hypothetical protein
MRGEHQTRSIGARHENRLFGVHLLCFAFPRLSKRRARIESPLIGLYHADGSMYSLGLFRCALIADHLIYMRPNGPFQFTKSANSTGQNARLVYSRAEVTQHNTVSVTCDYVTRH